MSTSAMITFLERRLWLSLVIFAVVGVVVSLTALHLGGGTPGLSLLSDRTSGAFRGVPEAQVQDWFAPDNLTHLLALTNGTNPFYTLYFQPPAPPPPPPTKKVDLLYQGCIVSSKGQPQAFIRLGENLLILTNGAKVVADHAIQSIGMKSVTLTNNAAKTNILQFNVKATLEVPAS